MENDLAALLALQQKQQQRNELVGSQQLTSGNVLSNVADSAAVRYENDAADGPRHLLPSSSSSSSKPAFVLRGTGVEKRYGCDSPTTAPNNNGAILPPSDCLARLETDDAVYFVCKPSLIIGRETGHSPADVSFKETFVSRAHLELFYGEDGWRLKCNGKNGVFLNDLLYNKGLADTVLPPECTLRFPSTEIEVKFSSKFPVFLPTNLASYENAVYNNAINSLSNNNKDGFTTSSAIQQESAEISNCIRLPSPLTVDTGDKNDLLRSSVDICCEKDIEDASADSADNNFCSENSGDFEKEGKPPYSYAQLIVQAIASTPDRQLTLAGIYAYITKHYAYYRTCDKGWQNSIRHNLSLCRHFVRVPRSQDEPGKGSFWRIDPICETKQVQLAFKKRRQGKSGSLSNNVATSSSITSCIIGASPSNSNTSPPCYSSFDENNEKTRSGSAPVSPTSATAPSLPSGSLTALKRGSLPAVCYMESMANNNGGVGHHYFASMPNNGPLIYNNNHNNMSDTNLPMSVTFSPQSSVFGGADEHYHPHQSRRFSQQLALLDEPGECTVLVSSGGHQHNSKQRHSSDESTQPKVAEQNSLQQSRTGTTSSTTTASLVLPLISEKTRNSILERHQNKVNNNNEQQQQPLVILGGQSNEASLNDGTKSRDNHQPLKVTFNNNSQLIKQRSAYSPQQSTGSRYISQSAPSSPKSYKSINRVEEDTSELDSGRVHHHSGGTFSVRRNAADGRQRLQICYSRPFHVEVSTCETSALEKLSQESRSRQNSGHHQVNGVISGSSGAAYCRSGSGGSKSLSTTPVRELLAAGVKTLAGRSVDGEVVSTGAPPAGHHSSLGVNLTAISQPFALGVGGGLTSREYNNGKRLESLKQRSMAKLSSSTTAAATMAANRNESKATTMVTPAHHRQHHQPHLPQQQQQQQQHQPVPIAPNAVAAAAASLLQQQRSAPPSPLGAALTLQALGATLGVAQAAAANPYSAAILNSASLVSSLVAANQALVLHNLGISAGLPLVPAPNSSSSSLDAVLTSALMNGGGGAAGPTINNLLPAAAVDSHSLLFSSSSTGSAFGLVGTANCVPSASQSNLFLTTGNGGGGNNYLKRTFFGAADPSPPQKVIKRE